MRHLRQSKITWRIPHSKVESTTPEPVEKKTDFGVAFKKTSPKRLSKVCTEEGESDWMLNMKWEHKCEIMCVDCSFDKNISRVVV